LFILNYFRKNIFQLNLSSITASPETLRVLSESFPKLTKIAYCGMTQTNEKAFLFLLKSMASRLRSVDFRGCARLKGSFFTLFGTALEEVFFEFIFLNFSLIKKINNLIKIKCKLKKFSLNPQSRNNFS